MTITRYPQQGSQGSSASGSIFPAFSNFPTASTFGVGIAQAEDTGAVYASDGASWTAIGSKTLLLPSGGDDAPIMAAVAKQYGVVNLGPGKFKWLTPAVFEGPDVDGVHMPMGVQLKGAGASATIIDTSEIDKALTKIHDEFKIIGITNASPCVITLDPSTPLPASGTTTWATGEARQVNGTKVWLQVPQSSQATNTMEAIGGITQYDLYLKWTSTTTAELYINSGLSTPLDTTNSALFGQFGTADVTEYGVTWNTSVAWKLIRYYGNCNYTPIARFVGSKRGALRENTFRTEVSGIFFQHQKTAITTGQAMHGLCLGIESERTTGNDTQITEGVIIRDVAFYGYQACALLDDVTNAEFDSVDFQNNVVAVMSGYNMDIINFNQCHLGNEGFLPGVQLQIGMMTAPVYNAPASTKAPGSGQSNSIMFESCWFMNMHDIGGDLHGQQLTFKSCYGEKNRTWVTRGKWKHLVVEECHFSNFPFHINLKNGECIFGACQFAKFENNESIDNLFPKFGWAAVEHWVATEDLCSRLVWNNNYLPVSAWTAGQNEVGHIKYSCYAPNFSRNHFITLFDDLASGTEKRLGRGFYSFIGALQVSGDRRRYVGTLSVANNYVIIPELYNLYMLTLATNATIRNPASSVDEHDGYGRTWFDHTASGAHARAFKMMPLQIILIQDGTGGRTVAFGTQYLTTGLDNGATATAGQRSALTFEWDGAKLMLTKQTPWH